jgi:hypothetical protein
MDAKFVRVVDVIGIGHCVKEEVLTVVLTLEMARDNGIDGMDLTFIPERVQGVLAPWGCKGLKL